MRDVSLCKSLKRIHLTYLKNKREFVLVLLNMFHSDVVNHMDYWEVKCILATEQEMCEALSEYHLMKLELGWCLTMRQKPLLPL